ncbi:MAG: extracellular solute-binding protein, partial [Oscillospiraceae bacterium]|nr:extracellular solute-binding protein [Oscillospiraceae bacterium]
MKKLVAILLVCVLSLSLLAGCGGASSTAPSSSQAGSSESTAPTPVTLKVSTWDNASDPHTDMVIEAFEKAYPHITVDLIDIPGTEYNNKLNIMLNGGSELDVFWVKDSSSTKDVFDKGQIEDLTGYIKADGIDLSIYKGLDENFAFEGEQAGLPFRTDYYVLFYNKDLFDAAGI